MMKHISEEVINSFPAPNYENPSKRGSGLLVMNVPMTIIVFGIIMLRLYTRIFVQKWFGSDDVLIIISMAVTLALTSVILVAYRDAFLGRHIWDIRPGDLPDTLVFDFVGKILFGIACTCIRASFLCFYQRLLRTTNNKWYKYSLWAVWTYVLSLEVITFLIQMFGCRPINASWTFPVQLDSRCLDEGLTNTVLAAFHCNADFMVTVWPIPIILKLQLPKRVRIYIIALLNVGFTVTIAGCLRAYFIWTANASYDLTWRSYPTWFVAGLELYLGMICACAPAIRPLFTRATEPAVAVVNARFSTVRPRPHDSGSLEKFSENRVDSISEQAFEITSEIRGGGSNTPITLDEEFSDMRNRAAITGILVRTTFRVENSLPSTSGTSRRPSVVRHV